MLLQHIKSFLLTSDVKALVVLAKHQLDIIVKCEPDNNKIY